MPTLSPTAIPARAAAAVRRYVARVGAAFAAVLTRQWWADVAEASVAQAWQVAAPFAATLWATHTLTGSAVAAVALQVAGAVAVVVLRRLTALTVADDAPLDVKTAARVVSALAGALAGFGVNLAAGNVAGVDWAHVLLASVGSAFLALLHRSVDPATSDVLVEAGRVQDAAVALATVRGAELAAGRTITTGAALSAVLPLQRDTAPDTSPSSGPGADTVGEA